MWLKLLIYPHDDERHIKIDSIIFIQLWVHDKPTSSWIPGKAYSTAYNHTIAQYNKEFNNSLTSHVSKEQALKFYRSMYIYVYA